LSIGDAALRERLHDPFAISRRGDAGVVACLRRGADGADDRGPVPAAVIEELVLVWRI
jgi:hypothetical protein